MKSKLRTHLSWCHLVRFGVACTCKGSRVLGRFALIAATLASCFAADIKAPVVTQKQVDAIAAHWQHELRLDDWAVYVHIVRREDLREGTMGNSYRSTLHRVIQINVLNPQDYHLTSHKVGKEIVADIKDTVVHELVHLRVADVTKHLVLSEDSDDLTDEQKAARSELKAEFSAAEETLVVRLTAALLKENRLP